MKICIFLVLMSIFIAASYSAAWREDRAQPGSARSGRRSMPQG
jgi:hypothetical protein